MASPGSTPGGVKASSSETFDRGVDVSRSTGGRDWGGATFGDPRTPEKAQRRLGGLTKKKKKKKKYIYIYLFSHSEPSQPFVKGLNMLLNNWAVSKKSSFTYGYLTAR